MLGNWDWSTYVKYLHTLFSTVFYTFHVSQRESQSKKKAKTNVFEPLFPLTLEPWQDPKQLNYAHLFSILIVSQNLSEDSDQKSPTQMEN